MKLIRLTGTITPCESWGPLVEGHYYEVTAYTIRGQLPDTMLAKRINEDYLLECTGVELSSFVDARKQQQGPGNRESRGSEPVSVSTLDLAQFESTSEHGHGFDCCCLRCAKIYGVASNPAP